MPLDNGLPVWIPEPDLVLERGHHVVPETRDALDGRAEDLSCRELARGAVGPARRGQADAPARTPGELPDRVGVGMHDQVRRAGADPEPLVVGDRRVDRVQTEDQVGHHRPVAQALTRMPPAEAPCLGWNRSTSGIPSSTNSSLLDPSGLMDSPGRSASPTSDP